MGDQWYGVCPRMLCVKLLYKMSRAVAVRLELLLRWELAKLFPYSLDPFQIFPLTFFTLLALLGFELDELDLAHTYL